LWLPTIQTFFNHVIGFGGNAVMTSESCKNGTETYLGSSEKAF
jgi:CMP-2-keto-3-deoxyoctulosonic acid synthetase